MNLRPLKAEPGGDLPPAPLLALAGRWDLTQGEHPALVAPLARQLGQLPLFPTLEEWRELSTLGLPIDLAWRGHHVWVDHGPQHAAHPERLDETPMAPVFVRDLCGRVIHTGLLPYPIPPASPTFPAGCADVPATMGGAAHLEQAVFTHWHLLEVAPPGGSLLAGEPGLQVRAAYAQPQAVPYKIRPSTCYADGWRLPQVPRVYARAVAGAEEVARTELLDRWEARPAGQDYESFHEACGGLGWSDALFLQGVTLIPTLEAYNGAYQVAEDFSLSGVEPGRAVPGLHEVVRTQPHAAPHGTILAVERPGYVTATSVLPAQVVVSAGPALPPPDALLPNLAWPHAHLAPAWGACWLPTQPAHFRAPALWDWLPSGQFVQVSGPLWAPEHYVYASTAALVRACARPLEACPTLLTLPASLPPKFCPVVPLSSYDTLNERTRLERADKPEHALHGSALDQVLTGAPLTELGYHPLPPEWPRPTQAAWQPEQSAVPPCPPELTARLAPAAKLLVEPDTLTRHHISLSEPQRAVVQEAEAAAPTSAELPVSWLAELPASKLQLNVKRVFANRSYRAALALVDEQLPADLFRFREAALAWRRRRYRLETKYPGAWAVAEREGLPLELAEQRLPTLELASHAEAARHRRAGLTRVPAAAALPLHAKPSKARLKRGTT